MCKTTCMWDRKSCNIVLIPTRWYYTYIAFTGNILQRIDVISNS